MRLQDAARVERGNGDLSRVEKRRVGHGRDPAAAPDVDLGAAISIRMVEPRVGEERDVVAPFGAKAVSAVPVVTSPAAIASAVRAATGRPVNRLPIRPH